MCPGLASAQPSHSALPDIFYDIFHCFACRSPQFSHSNRRTPNGDADRVGNRNVSADNQQWLLARPKNTERVNFLRTHSFIYLIFVHRFSPATTLSLIFHRATATVAGERQREENRSVRSVLQTNCRRYCAAHITIYPAERQHISSFLRRL